MFFRVLHLRKNLEAQEILKLKIRRTLSQDLRTPHMLCTINTIVNILWGVTSVYNLCYIL